MKTVFETTQLIFILLSVLFTAQVQAETDPRYQPEAGSTELDSPQKKEQRQKKRVTQIDPELPMVLILGDSISIGYTEPLRELLAGKANILRNPGNSQGTTHTLAQIDSWLAVQKWDVIHFNLGLHDLKRVTVAGTGENSNDPNDPYQADLETYTRNLEKIAKKLKATGAKLVFATTTPFPQGVKPYRDPSDVERYNSAAVEVMGKNEIEVNDLCAFISPNLAKLQKPKNVHFTPEGSMELAAEVERYISDALGKGEEP